MRGHDIDGPGDHDLADDVTGHEITPAVASRSLTTPTRRPSWWRSSAVNHDRRGTPRRAPQRLTLLRTRESFVATFGKQAEQFKHDGRSDEGRVAGRIERR